MLLKIACTLSLYIGLCTPVHALLCASRPLLLPIKHTWGECSWTEVDSSPEQPLIVSAQPTPEWAAMFATLEEARQERTKYSVATWAPVISAFLVACTLCWTFIRHHREQREKKSEHFMERAFDLAKRAYEEMDQSQTDFRRDVEGGAPLIVKAPKRDAALWMTVAEMIKEACALRASIVEPAHKRTYDAEIKYWRLKFSQLLRRGFPRLYYGDWDVMRKFAFAIQERHLVAIYRFADGGMDISNVQDTQFNDDELLGFVIGERPGLHEYITYLRQA